MNAAIKGHAFMLEHQQYSNSNKTAKSASGHLVRTDHVNLNFFFLRFETEQLLVPQGSELNGGKIQAREFYVSLSFEARALQYDMENEIWRG
jgi:hypothetical protein